MLGRCTDLSRGSAGLQGALLEPLPPADLLPAFGEDQGQLHFLGLGLSCGVPGVVPNPWAAGADPSPEHATMERMPYEGTSCLQDASI